ncbi:MAG: 50S ribosomal protein L25 [Actinomycetota bacterium]
MQAQSLTATSGRELGTGASRRLRASGRVPGIVYGKDRDATALSVEWPALRGVLASGGTNALVNLDLDGEELLTLIYDVQRDPVKLSINHVDFLVVQAGQPIQVAVPLRLSGVAEQVGRRGAVVEQQLNELQVLAPPSAIPAELVLDITNMTLDENLTVRNLDLPERVELVDVDDDQILAVAKKTRATLALERENARKEAGDFDDDGEGGEAPEGDGE